MHIHEAGALHAEAGQRDPAWMRAPNAINELAPCVWPATAARNASGELTVGDISVTELVAEFGTPAYVLDETDFRARCHDFVTSFSGADVFYAGKAFLCRAVARMLMAEGLHLDVCTSGELSVALAAGVPPQRIGLHGNNKSSQELARAIDVGVGRIIVDSFHEIDRLTNIVAQRTAAGWSGRPRVMVRVTVGVEAHTHEYIATAHEDQKFGFSLGSGAAAAAVDRILAEDTLELIGLHSHIGSQIFDTEGFAVAARRVLSLQAAIRDQHGIQLPEFNLGGGFGIAYTEHDDPSPPAQLADSLRRIVKEDADALGLDLPRLSIEPGRALIGPAVFTLYQVGTVKDVDGIRTYVSVDGGMSDNIRPALYDASYSVVLANRISQASPMLARVVGKHCESGDIVVKNAYLPEDIRLGDLLAVPATGAYCRSMASNYNHVPRPPVISVRDRTARVIVRRETEDDLLALDVG